MDLSADKLHELREDLVSVISKYFEIDLRETECTLQQNEKEVAFIANIPVKRFKS